MVAEYVTGLKTAWDIAKAIKVATDSIDNAQIKLQMADLISALADAKIEAAENAEKIADLERRLRAKVAMSFENGVYYRVLDGGDKEGPFCPSCHDSNSKDVRLQHTPGSTFGDYQCYVCNGCFR